MRRFLVFLGGLFLIAMTLLILGYASIFVLLNQQAINELHEEIPALGYIGSFLGVYDVSYLQDKIYQEKQRIGSNIEEFIKWKQAGNGPANDAGHWLELADVRNDIALYSPYWKFVGRVSEEVTSLQLIYAHSGRDVTKIFDIDLEKNESFYDWSYEVHLGKETLFNGENEYVIEATFSDGRILSRKIRLQVAYERIELGDTMMYIDSGYIPGDETQDIIREAPDFNGNMSSFITYGCDPEKPAPNILIERAFQYTTMPACGTFSLIDDYLLWFDFKERTSSSYLYDIVSPVKGVLYSSYPLFYYDLHSAFYSLVFRDRQRNRLKFLSSKGDKMSYTLEMFYYDIEKQKKVVSIQQVDGAQLLVENDKEKMLVYMYKAWDSYRSLLYPGVRYQFWYHGKQINQGAMYTLPLRLYAPQQTYGPTFSFDVSLDGTRLYIDDGIKRMSFDILLMGKTIEIIDSVQKLDQPGICDGIFVDIYQNTRGDDLHDARASDTLWMVGKGIHASSMKIFYNDVEKPVDPEQLYQGWFHLRINSEKGMLQSGENEYTIVTYNNRGKESCSISKKIIVQ